MLWVNKAELLKVACLLMTKACKYPALFSSHQKLQFSGIIQRIGLLFRMIYKTTTFRLSSSTNKKKIYIQKFWKYFQTAEGTCWAAVPFYIHEREIHPHRPSKQKYLQRMMCFCCGKTSSFVIKQTPHNIFILQNVLVKHDTKRDLTGKIPT